MSQSDFRIPIGNLTAQRTTATFAKAKGSNPAARLGLQYERRVGKALERHITKSRFLKLEHNPWFKYSDDYGIATCSPDYLLWFEDRAIIIEVKLTWVPSAIHKLAELYMPVISCALNAYVLPLVICRNLTPKAPKAQITLGEALTSDEKLLHWPNIGQIPW